MIAMHSLMRRHSRQKKPLEQDQRGLQAVCMTTQDLPRHEWQLQWCSDTVEKVQLPAVPLVSSSVPVLVIPRTDRAHPGLVRKLPTLISKLQSVLARSERLIRAIQGLLSKTGTLRLAQASSGSATCA